MEQENEMKEVEEGAEDITSDGPSKGKGRRHEIWARVGAAVFAAGLFSVGLWMSHEVWSAFPPEGIMVFGFVLGAATILSWYVPELMFFAWM